MAVYHIKKDGTPGVCSAEGPCPLGGSDSHFESETDAYEEAQRRMENIFGVVMDDEIEVNILSKPGAPRVTLRSSEIKEAIPRGNSTIVVTNSGEHIVCDLNYSEFERFGL